MMAWLQDRKLMALFLCLLTFLLYGGIFNNFWYMDDTSGPLAGMVLTQDPAALFSRNFDVIYMTRLWRVVVAASYVPNYLLSGVDPWSYQLVSLLLHGANGLLVFLIVRTLVKEPLVPALAALLFTASFNKADAIFMVAHRTTLLGAFFALLAIWCFARLLADEACRPRWGLLCLGALLAGIFSYETNIVVPAVLLAMVVCLQPCRLRRWPVAVTVLLATLLSGGLIAAFGFAGKSGILQNPTLVGRALHVWRNALAVIPSFLIPPQLLQEPGLQPTAMYHSIGSAFGWIEWLGLGLLVAGGLFAWRCRSRAALFALLAYLILAVPTATVAWLYYPGGAHEQFGLGHYRWSVGKFSYLSSFGIYLFFALGLGRLVTWLRQRRGERAATIAVAALLALTVLVNFPLVWQREGEWDRLTNVSRGEFAAVRRAGITVEAGTLVKIYGFAMYPRHAANLLRAILRQPDLEIVDAAANSPPPAGTKRRSLFVIYDGRGAVSVSPGA